MTSRKGKLYLIPAPLGEHAEHTIPRYVIDILHGLDHFIVERARTARHFIKSTQPVKAFDGLTFFELNKHTDQSGVGRFLEPALAGHDIGLLSEAGCPGVADPGAQVVRLAHARGIEVVPLVGPSSILLALMASGMNGQSFAFHGYLSPRRAELARDLRRLEQLALRQRQTQIVIETPYRNMAFLETALETLSPQTLFGVAADLTLPTQYIRSQTVKEWSASPRPDLHKRPAIFLLGTG